MDFTHFWRKSRGSAQGQFPISALRVLYTKTGTNLAATLLRDSEAIVENGLYWTSASSEGEAYYLMAILNSETTHERVEKWQATGQWGARHFDKVNAWQTSRSGISRRNEGKLVAAAMVRLTSH